MKGLIGVEPASTERLGGGQNSRVYRVDLPGSDRYVAKVYDRFTGRGRGRLQAEFDGLRFLWDNGERAVPRPVAADYDSAFALYQYVDGIPVVPSEVTESDIDQAVAFLLRLKGLAGREGSGRLPPAAEACFSVREIVQNIRVRRDRLLELRGPASHEDLIAFLRDGLNPALEAVSEWCESTLEGQGLSVDSQVEAGERTLSPSDFGFHNAVRMAGGEIVFLDFEYFGWDDPAKMVSDFLLHPAMDLSNYLKRRFFARTTGGYDTLGRLAERVRTVYPLFGLKWCLIFLNEFAPEHLERRRFASDGPIDSREVQSRQLAKARRMLRRIQNEHQSFPYGD